ncbi:MAG: hypothetical protein QM747_07565 [Nocardioides sp.]
MNLTRQRGALAGLAAAGLLLSGCGSSLGIHPGAAVVVGDQSVAMSKVDKTSVLFCKVYVTQSQSQASSSQSGPIPMGSFRSYAASSLAKRALGSQLAEKYDVSPASGYQQQVSQYQAALASSPADQRDAAIEVAGADAYLQNVEVAIGQKLTGQNDTTNAALKAALQRGEVVATEWFADHKAYVNPVYGLAVDDGKFTTAKDQTSYPLSALASAGAQTTAAPDDSYTSALSASQLCE